MKLFYIDESGDTIPLTQKGKKYFILSGCVIDESNIIDIQIKFRKIKKEFYQNEEIEIKSNFLRYANPDINIDSPLKLNSRKRYDELEDSITKFLKDIDVTLFSVVIDKEAYWQKYPAQNPYQVAYIFLLERFQKYLKEDDSQGICIIDPREGQVEKHYFGDEISRIHTSMRWKDGKIWAKCPNVVEKLLFSQSDQTIGIQIVDLYCYPIFHMFEYDKKPGEYWRYDELSTLKLYKNKNGTMDESGLKFFPDNKKKDLRFYA